MLFVKRPLGQFLILGGGIVMLILSIGCEARYGATSRVTYDLIAGLVIAVIGGLHVRPGISGGLGVAAEIDRCPSAGRVSGRRAMAARSTATASTARRGHRDSGELLTADPVRTHPGMHANASQPITSMGSPRLRRWRRSAAQTQIKTRHTRGATMCCSSTGTIWAAISGCTVTPTCRARGWTSWPPRASCSPAPMPPRRCARRHGDRCSPAAIRRATAWSDWPTTAGSTARVFARCRRSSPNPVGIRLFSGCNTKRHTLRG